MSRDHMVLSWVRINTLPKFDSFLFNEYTKNVKIPHQLPHRSNNSREWRWRPLVRTWVKDYLYFILSTRLETWQISHVNIANCDRNNINLCETTFNIIFITHKSQSITSIIIEKLVRIVVYLDLFYGCTQFLAYGFRQQQGPQKKKQNKTRLTFLTLFYLRQLWFDFYNRKNKGNYLFLFFYM